MEAVVMSCVEEVQSAFSPTHCRNAVIKQEESYRDLHPGKLVAS